MARIYEEDVLGSGKNQLIISNDVMRVIIVPEFGGRIADVHPGKVLYRTYPRGVSFGPYTEYGGIEECIGSAPGTLWNTKWEWEQKDDGVLLQAISKNILIRKLISLDESIISIEYDFSNIGNTFSKFTFGIHPEIAIAGNHRDNRYSIPSGNDIITGGYQGPGTKKNITPSEGWCAITYQDNVFGQMLPEGVIDAVEAYYPRVDTHVVLQPLIYSVGISPEMRAGFSYMAYIGSGDAQKIRQIYKDRTADLAVKYEAFDRKEIPESVISSFESQQKQEEIGVPPFFPHGHNIKIEIPKIPPIPPIPEIKIPKIEIPKIEIPDIASIIQNAIGNVQRTGFQRTTGKKADIQTGKLSGSSVNIEHVKGNIDIQGWDQDKIDYTISNGTAKQGDGSVSFETTGNLSLKIPKNTKINMNFVNGNVSVIDMASSLKISGVTGKVNTEIRIPDDASIEISLLTGDISLKIPQDSSCNISAAITGRGDILCDLPLQDEVRDRSQLKGTLRDGSAKVSLNTINGNISIYS